MASRIVDPRLEEEAFEAESRSDGRRAERVREEAMARLATDLARVSGKKLMLLELPEPLVDAISAVRLIASAPARNRQLRLVRALLREQDWVALRTRLDTLLETGALAAEGTVSARADDGALDWTLRLIGEGVQGIEAFVAEFPRADRTHLRQLVRAVHKASDERRIRAERQLTAALRGFLR